MAQNCTACFGNLCHPACWKRIGVQSWHVAKRQQLLTKLLQLQCKHKRVLSDLLSEPASVNQSHTREQYLDEHATADRSA